MLILQKIMQEGKDIICSEGQDCFSFINSAYIKATEKSSSTTQTELEQSSTSMVTTINVKKSTNSGRQIQQTKR